MDFGIIAAGEGSRLMQEGITVPKPLVKVNNECLVDRLLRIFNGFHPKNGTVLICNSRQEETVRHFEHRDAHAGNATPFTIIVKSTPSSMHSFYELTRHFNAATFCVTTVDTIFTERAFAAYLKHFERFVAEGYDGCMGVTDYIDDESPLYVETDERMNIVNILDRVPDGASIEYISAGIYGLTPKAIDVLEQCIRQGEQRMRNFQRALLRAGLRLKAFPMGKVMDVDHAADIEKAEQFLTNEEKSFSHPARQPLLP